MCGIPQFVGMLRKCPFVLSLFSAIPCVHTEWHKKLPFIKIYNSDVWRCEEAFCMSKCSFVCGGGLIHVFWLWLHLNSLMIMLLWTSVGQDKFSMSTMCPNHRGQSFISQSGTLFIVSSLYGPSSVTEAASDDHCLRSFDTLVPVAKFTLWEINQIEVQITPWQTSYLDLFQWIIIFGAVWFYWTSWLDI